MRDTTWPAELRKLPLFAGCTAAELQGVGALLTPTDIPAGETFLREDAPGYQVLILVDGSATVSRQGRDVAVLGPGDVAGELAALGGGRRSASVTALTPVRAYACTRAEFMGILAVAPSVGEAVRRIAAERQAANAAAAA
jgi:CRP-like cAMP-binding protein